jgi:hypothetical protein
VLEDLSPTTAGMAVGEIDITRDLTAPKKTRLGLIVGVGLAVAGAAAAAVVALKPPPPRPVDPVAESPAGVAAGMGTPPTAPPPVTAPPSALASGGSADANLKTCAIITEPAGVKVFDAAAPDVQVGVTKPGGLTVRIGQTTKYILRQTGYKDTELTLDFAADPCLAQTRLKAMPKAISQTGAGPAGTNQTGGGTVVIGGGNSGGNAPVAAPDKPETPTKKDISLQ